MPVCQQRVITQLQFRYFRQPKQQGRYGTYDISQQFFSALEVRSLGTGRLNRR